MMLQNEPLANHTYMKVGGPADYLTVVTNTEELVDAITIARTNHQRCMVIGGGSNTIFSDAGYRGLIIVNHSKSESYDPTTGIAKVDSGLPMSALVNHTVQAGLDGLAEFLGIPGTVGGAVYNNSHFGKKLIGSYVSQVEIIGSNNIRQWVPATALGFAYDYSNIQITHDTLLQVEFHLTPSDSQNLKEIAMDSLKKRQTTQPLSVPSSGCMFQNLPTIAAGALIDQAGLKGRRVGGAEVSTQHANFIINSHQAKTQDIIDLSNEIIAIIQEKFGQTLKREVFIVDEFGERINE